MFKDYFFIFVFCFSFSGFSQQPEINSGDWYLINLHLNSEDNFRPVRADGNPIVSVIDERNYGTVMDTYICDSCEIVFDVDTENSKFICYSSSCTLGGCDSIEHATGIDTSDIESKFMQFWSFQNTTQRVFDYQIIEENLDQPRELTITDAEGNYAQYYYNTLATKQVSSIPSFSIYPNPVKDKLIVSATNNLSHYNVEIFDVFGKLKVSEQLKSKSINVEHLPNGVYFLVMKDALGYSIAKKFVK